MLFEMKIIEMLRAKLDHAYSSTLYGLIGAAIICNAVKVLLATSMFDDMTSWLIAVTIAALFYYALPWAVFFYAVAVFLSLGHINALAITLIFPIIVSFCEINRVVAFCAMILPLCFLPDSVFSGWQFCGLIMMLCLCSRYSSKKQCVACGIYYSLFALMSAAAGFGNVFPFELRNIKFVSVESYLAQLNYKTMAKALLSSNITTLIIAVAIYGVLGAVLYDLFYKISIGKRVLAFDVADMLKFLIAGAALAVAVLFTAKVFALSYTLPVGTILLQTACAWLISRPFTSDVFAKEFPYENGERIINGSSRTEAPEATESVPDVPADKWSSIVGYEQTKEEIRRVIRPYTSKREYDRILKAGMHPTKGILLYGPPGTGKTTIARASAHETKMSLVVINASSFQSKYVGESERNLVEAFTTARAKAPCLLCFDEIESFLMDRTKASQSYQTSIVSTFLTQMDGFAGLNNVLVVGTTNDPTQIDHAALRPGRFDKVIYVGVPDVDARTALFEKYLKGKTNTQVDCRKLAEHSERFTGADIRALCETAFQENDLNPITEELLLRCLSMTRPSFTLEMQKNYELWAKKYNRSTSAQEDNQAKTGKRLRWDDIKGMDSVKKLMQEKIELPIRNAERYTAYGISAPKGILLFGPPGCGKTFFAKVAADESNATFYTINGPELLERGVGESEKNLRKVFMDARETKPSILFFDEIDAIAESRGTNSGGVRLINQLLTELDGMEELSGVTVIAATNRPEYLDTALLRAGRFDTKIYIPMPDQDAIRQMVVGQLGDLPCDADIDTVTAALTGYTCADVATIINKAKTYFVNRSAEGDDAPLHTDEILSIISKAKPSISPEEAKAYEMQRSLESWA